MSWFRVDDKSAFHRKVLAAGNEAWGAFCRAGAISSGEGTDGRVTVDTCRAIAPAKVWTRLIDVGLAERVDGSTDLQLHDYLEWNPSAAEVAAAVTAKRAAGKAGGLAKAAARLSGSKQASNANSETIAAASQVLEQVASKHLALSHPIPSQPEEGDAPPAAAAVRPGKLKGPSKAHRAPAPDDPGAATWLAGHGIPALDDPQHGRQVRKMLVWSQTSPKGAKVKWPLVWDNVWRESDAAPSSPSSSPGTEQPFFDKARAKAAGEAVRLDASRLLAEGANGEGFRW